IGGRDEDESGGGVACASAAEGEGRPKAKVAGVSKATPDIFLEEEEESVARVIYEKTLINLVFIL
nr:hypothetical protein [Tanacetum cinerariifolium]